MPKEGRVHENYSVEMIEASSTGEGDREFANNKLMGEEHPLITMPSSP